MSDNGIGCRGGCGAKVVDEEAAQAAGWAFLEISKGYRCGACDRELRAANAIVGTDGQTLDALPPDSRGALPKETASTIAAPSVPRNPQGPHE